MEMINGKSKKNCILISVFMLLLIFIIGGIFFHHKMIGGDLQYKSSEVPLLSPVVKGTGDIERMERDPFVLTPTNTKMPELGQSEVDISVLTPTNTEMALLEQTEIEQLVDDNLQNNAGCDLPCWWGIETGKTELQTALEYFNSIDSTGELQETVIKTSSGKKIEYSKGFHYPYEYINDDWKISWLVSGIDNIVTKIEVASKSNTQLSFTNVFKAIGNPDSISIMTFSNVPGYPSLEPYLPFNVALIYEEEHLIFWYHLEGQKIDGKIIACQENPVIEMSVWDEAVYGSRYKTYLLNIIGGDYLEGSQNLKTLSEVSNMEIGEFVELFLDNPDACIETPAEYW